MKRSLLIKPAVGADEIYAGAIIQPDGCGHHMILLPGDMPDAGWKTLMGWAASLGGDLPDCVEQSHLFATLPSHFKPEWYWSNMQRIGGSIWVKNFSTGNQCWTGASGNCRARAIRRVPFQLWKGLP